MSENDGEPEHKQESKHDPILKPANGDNRGGRLRRRASSH
ncbi:hypothetical protein A2U01_0087590, partial [Trifolium medium]|nr:hypothetical protein [Trifolium medium]